MGTVYKNGKPLTADDTRGETNGVDIDILIDTFWNNRFVYEQVGRLKYNRWQKMSLEQIVEVDWEDTANNTYRLDRFPPKLKTYRDYFVEDI